MLKCIHSMSFCWLNLMSGSFFVSLFFVIIFIYIQELMPPKIQRYATEPKKQQKFLARASGKMTSMTKNTIKKVLDFKRFTVSNNIETSIFKDGQVEGNCMSIFSCKKKSFVVTKRKANKSILQEHNTRILDRKSRNEWIQFVEHDTYQGLRDYNQDRVLIKQGIDYNNESLSIFAVFDGHGGSSASEYLKIHFCKVFEGFIENFEIQDALKKSILQLQNRIIKCGVKINSGSCATILVIKQNQYWAANVGDSRILIVKDIEDFKQVTEDHKPENLKQYKRIQMLGGKIYRNLVIDESTGQKSYGPFRVMPSKLSVTRAIGDFPIKKNQTEELITAQPEIYSGRIQFNDVILLFSDGAYERFTNEEISILFSPKTKQTLKQRMNNFIFSAKKRQTNDNTSIIGIQIRSKDKTSSTSASSGDQPSFSNLQIKL